MLTLYIKVIPVRCLLTRLQQSEIKFYTHILSKNGTKTDPAKTWVLTSMGKPENISEVKSLLRMTLSISPYIPGYARITAPL